MLLFEPSKPTNRAKATNCGIIISAERLHLLRFVRVDKSNRIFAIQDYSKTYVYVFGKLIQNKGELRTKVCSFVYNHLLMCVLPKRSDSLPSLRDPGLPTPEPLISDESSVPPNPQLPDTAKINGRSCLIISLARLVMCYVPLQYVVCREKKSTL